MKVARANRNDRVNAFSSNWERIESMLWSGLAPDPDPLRSNWERIERPLSRAHLLATLPSSLALALGVETGVGGEFISALARLGWGWACPAGLSGSPWRPTRPCGG